MTEAKYEMCAACAENGEEQLAIVSGDNGGLCPMHYMSLLIFKSAKGFGYSDEEAIGWTKNILASAFSQIDNISEQSTNDKNTSVKN